MRRLHLTEGQTAVLQELRDVAAAELVQLRFDDVAEDQTRIRTQVHFRAKFFLLQELLNDDFSPPSSTSD